MRSRASPERSRECLRFELRLSSYTPGARATGSTELVEIIQRVG